MTEQLCPCGSGLPLANCCGPLHAGKPAATAEALMRSRYAAYVLGDIDYVRNTWTPETWPPAFPPDTTEWIGLRIVRTDKGGEADDEGIVEFVAAFREKGKVLGLHETSRFVKREGRWLYADGKPKLESFGRNDPCPCGSGRKVKQCCGGRA